MNLTLIVAILLLIAGLVMLARPVWRFGRLFGALFLILAAFNFARHFQYF